MCISQLTDKKVGLAPVPVAPHNFYIKELGECSAGMHIYNIKDPPSAIRIVFGHRLRERI